MSSINFIPFIKELARVSAEAILPHFGNSSLEVSAKVDASPVTVADRNAELRMRELIAQRFPEHGIIGEEFGNERLDAEYVWILDPIDGTKSFITGVPLFTTLIGLLHHDEPIYGAIHQPILKQLCIGDNSHCWLNDQLVKVRQRDLGSATLLISDPYSISQFQNVKGWQALVDATKVHRSWGDGYGYMLVATGWADVMCDPVLEPWDVLPVIPVLQGAGATVTDWHGERIRYTSGKVARSAVAAHPDNHGKVIELLRKIQ